MKKFTMMCLVTALATAVSSSAFAEALYDWVPKGSYSVGKSATVVMPEDGEVYLNLSGIKVGSPYTFVAAGPGASVSVVYIYNSDGDTWDSYLSTGDDDLKTENQNRCIVDSDSWIIENIVKDPEWEYEPGEWNETKVTPKAYFLYVCGDPGAAISLSSVSGIEYEKIPVGDSENPKQITPAAAPTTLKSNFVFGEYYLYMKANVGTYLLSTSGGTEAFPTSIVFDSDESNFSVSNLTESVVGGGNEAYLVKVTTAGRIDFHLSGGESSFGLTYQYASNGSLGRVTVETKGVDGTWSIKGASGLYESGESVAILGEQTIVFTKVNGFTTPANKVVTPTEDNPEIHIVGVYNDTFDPKDDTIKGATKITPSAKGITAARTLFAEDKYDYFAFTAKDGVYYNFKLADLVGEAMIFGWNKTDPEPDSSVIDIDSPTSILKWSPGKGDYILRVQHAGDSAGDCQYTLEATSANVGAISFAKTAVSVKKSVGQVQLTVNRSAAEGKVRVRYGTVNDTAKPGVDYFAQSGELVWEDGDKKAKTITIKLIPELFAETAISRQFGVVLEAIPESELEENEYPASFAKDKDIAVVTVTEAKAKAPAAVKAATVKTEVVPLRTGTFYGVLAEDGSALTNGFPQLASVTLTTSAKAGKPDTLSAKVALAGKTYNFKSDTKNPQDWEDLGDGTKAVTLTLLQTINKVVYTNALTLTVRDGTAADDWSLAGGTAELVMNVPDANGKGAQEEIVYFGELIRDNAKVQDYLYAVTNAVGYYTVALVPSGVSNYDGIPAGNGYLTLTIDNKGKVKVAGMLADGTTKPSYSSIVAIRDGGDTVLIPVFVAKSPYCFGGVIKLFRGEDGKYVVDSSSPLIWNNDDALQTYGGEEGWQIELDPVGGYFNTVNTLQAYYLTSAFSVSTAYIDEFPTELLTDGYSFVTDVQPTDIEVDLAGNAFSTAKKTMVKSGGFYDFTQSINPCNVQVKLARATGLVTGSFSVWSENEEGKQKEVTGFKHNGVLLLTRDEASPLDPEVMSAGFFSQKVTIKYEVTDAKGKVSKKTRKYNASMPFNVMAIDQGEPDWYADDWGEVPEE